MKIHQIVLWRRVSVVIFSLMYAIATMWSFWGTELLLPPQVVLVALLSLLIAVVVMPFLLAYEHWHADVDYRFHTMLETLVVLSVPFGLAFLSLVGYVSLVDVIVSAIAQTIVNAVKIGAIMWLCMSVGPTLRALRLIQ